MSDHPIIFSAPMVRALLEGRKTMTRRLAWRLPPPESRTIFSKQSWPTPWQKVKPGDRLWVRENWRVSTDACEGWSPEGECRGWIDCAAGDSIEVVAPSLAAVMKAGRVTDWDSVPSAWRPSIYMPRWASRLTLIVTATKIERLQDISEEESLAEGIDRAVPASHLWRAYEGATGTTPRAAFAMLWSHLHGRESWDANPEVVALSFTVHKTNIDKMAEAA